MTLEEALNSKRETEAQNRKREDEWLQEGRLE